MSEKTFTQEQLNAVVRNEAGQVVINPEIVAEQVRIGWKKDQFAKHYDMPITQVTNMLKALGLKIRKFHKPAFVIGGVGMGTSTVGATTQQTAEEVTETQETVEEVAEVNQENNNSESVQEQTEQDLETPGKEQVAEETETQVEETQEVADQSTPTRASWNNG